MTAYFDIDTQNDFVVPGGVLYNPGAERLIPEVARLNNAAAQRGFVLISTMCAHPPDAEEFKVWPPHCVVGTPGQRKPAETLLAQSSDQIIVEKNDLDVFSNPAVLPLLDRLSVDECFVYGVYLEYCVKCAIMGLLKSGRKVRLVTNATMPVERKAGDTLVQDFLAAGGQCVSL
jgi:nicotinamidase/pyrazinamidase